MTGIITLQPALPEVSLREVLRYGGCRAAEADEATVALAGDCIREAEPVLRLAACGTVLEIISLSEETGEVDMGVLRLTSRDLAKNLAGCTHAAVFAATAGLGLDRLAAGYSHRTPSRAVMLQAVGDERVEALCDAAERHFGCNCRHRFSPGYGDLPIEAQREVFALLKPEARIGLTLNRSLLMSPAKSVTAICGIR